MDSNEGKSDVLADLNLVDLRQRRQEAEEKRKKAAARVENAKADHLLRYWLGGCAMALVAVWLAQALPEESSTGMFFLSTSVVLWLGMWIKGFFSAGAVSKLQEDMRAAAWQVTQIDLKIAFCQQVLDEAHRVRVKRYARAMIEKEMT